MIELIKAIAEPVIKAISVKDLIEARKSKRIHAVGTELFLLYASLNEILITGRQIIATLEDVRGRVERSKPHGLHKVPHVTNLSVLLEHQAVNLRRSFDTINRLGLELQVIAPSVYLQVAPVFNGKGNLLHHIADIATEGLTRFDDDEIVEAIGPANQSRINSLLSKSGGLTEDLVFNYSSSVRPRLRPELVLPDLSTITYEGYERVVGYLDNHDPTQALDQLEKILIEFREKLEANFTLQEILLQVADKRLAMEPSVRPG